MNQILPLCLTSFVKGNKSILLGVFLVLCIGFNANAQGPGSLFVDAGPDVTIDCTNGSGCTDITATFLETFESISNTYTVDPITYNPPFPFSGLATQLNPNEDDRWSVVENLPFEFCYFENIESQFQVGSNGVIRFDVDPTDTSNGWSFTENLPNNTNSTLAEANVFTPGHDIDPSVSTTEEIGYEVLGDFPNRVLVVSYFEVPMFSCNNLLATQMVVFYEFSNVIEVYIQDKPVCSTWNSGNAALGIQNNDGNIAFVPPGRNTSDSPWTTNNEAWRFSPAGTETYFFEWVDSNGTVISTDPTTEVCPSGAETYTARVTYTNCNGEVVVLTDDVVVTSSVSFTADLGGDQTLCDTPSYEITAELDGADPNDATFLWSTGETTQTISVTATDLYSVDITVDGCTITESVTITFLTGQACNILPNCADIDFNEDFGTGIGRVCDLNGATTTYVCNTVSQVEDGEYSITNTSNGLNSGWHVGMEDHTPDDVDGRMLFINADDVTSGEFYRRSIILNENTDYTFNAWITTVYDTDTGICPGGGIPSNVKFRIEDSVGNTITETDTGDIPNGPEPNWQEYTIAFNTGANTEVQLVLFNNGLGGCGNDLAIDDITLAFENSQPQIATPDDLSACDETGNEEAVFDLDSVIPTVLDGLDPALFNVSFHHNTFDATSNNNPIVPSNAYQNIANPDTIYVRVEKVDEPDCFNVVDFDLIIEPIVDFQVELPPTLVICEGGDFPTWDATPQNPAIDLTLVTYSWQDSDGIELSTEAEFTPTAAGIYTVVVTLAPCNEASYTAEVVVNQAPILDLGVDQSICDGGVFEIIPTIEGDTTGITYLWSTGETTPTITVSSTGDYSLEITVGPCVASDSIVISLAENPIIELGAGFESCFDQDVVLDATPENYDGAEATYVWSQDGTILDDETTPLLFVTEAGTYEVTVSVGDCSSTDTITLTQRPDLVVSVDPDFKTCPDEIQVLTAVTDETDVSYQWSLNGDLLVGETSSTLEISIPANTMGEQIYTVTISVGDCTGFDSVGVVLYDVGQCVIPEGLSPNGDGLNDCMDLAFIADRTGSFSVEIFNRYGMNIFSQNSYVDEFCGIDSDGNALTTGTYFYVMKFDTPDPVYGSVKTGWIYINTEEN